MQEQPARDIVLVRAIETTDADGTLLSADDRRHASRAAAELAHWDAAGQRAPATAQLFLARRAALSLDRVGAREPVLRALRASRWRPWFGLLLPLAALALGVLTEQIGDRQHINVLAFPLLGIIAWNLVTYVLLLLRPLLGRPLGPLRRWIGGAVRAPGAAASGTVQAAVTRFVDDWSALATPLAAARAGRVLHLSAAAFALGALLGLYLRALAFEYRIGWESTFLQAPTVHAILATLLGPAARLLGTPFPPVEAIEAMRVSGGVGGSDAGPWIHWYAVTLGLTVIVPRLLLAAWSTWRERQLATSFSLDLGAPYFRRVLAAFAPANARVRAIPYSTTLSEAAVAGLGTLARHLFGDATQLALRPSVEYGTEEQAARDLPSREDDVPLTLVVFNAAATPESENHGRLLDTLRAGIVTPLALVVDTAPYRARLGAQAGAGERIDERCRAWLAFAAARGLPVSCLELPAPALAQAEADLAAALGAAA
jgi:hypothetical protein